MVKCNITKFSLYGLLLSLLFGSINIAYAEQGLTLHQAQKGIDAAHKHAAKDGNSLSCAVVNARGDLVALARMDGARFFTTGLAEGKALAASMFRRGSGDAERMVNSSFFPVLNGALQNRIIAVQGGVPILSGEEVIGGIGCSGASPQADEDAANAGLAAFN